MTTENQNELGFTQSVLDEFNVTSGPLSPQLPSQEEIEEVLQVKVGGQIIQGKDYKEIVEQLASQQEELLSRKNYNEPSYEEPYYPQEARAPLTAEELFLIGQNFVNDPIGAVEILNQELYGFTAEDIQDTVFKVREMYAQASGHKVGTEFAADHKKDYYPSPHNAQQMENFLIDEKLEVTRGNLEYAFNKLNQRGSLEPHPQQTAEKRENYTVPTGLSDRLNMGDHGEPSIPNVEKLNSMTADQLETWIKGEEAKRRGNPALNY